MFEITLRGWDGTDSTNHLIKWALATDIHALHRWITAYDLDLYIEDVHVMRRGNLTLADGVDVGIHWDLSVSTPDGKTGPFNPEQWINESRKATA